MSFFDYFRSSQRSQSASVAKERVQIIVAHERSDRGGTAEIDYLPDLQRELLAVVRKYVRIEDEHIKVNVERDGEYEVLELNIALPDAETRPTK